MITAFIDEDILQEITDYCTLRGFVIDPVGTKQSGRYIYAVRATLENEKYFPSLLQQYFEMGYELCRLQEKRVTRDIIEYINRWIPPFIYIGEKMYLFRLFPNHAHYDFRFCYDAGNDDEGVSDFKFLVENISNDRDLLQDLQWLRTQLEVERLLDGDYATREGYTKKKYQDWLDESSRKK